MFDDCHASLCVVDGDHDEVNGNLNGGTVEIKRSPHTKFNGDISSPQVQKDRPVLDVSFPFPRKIGKFFDASFPETRMLDQQSRFLFLQILIDNGRFEGPHIPANEFWYKSTGSTWVPDSGSLEKVGLVIVDTENKKIVTLKEPYLSRFKSMEDKPMPQ